MTKVYLGGLFLWLLFLSACRKCTDPTNPSCSNYNPCYNQQATTAQFTMMEFSDTNEMDPSLRQYWKFYDTDSAYAKVTFRATLDSAIYEWHIGSGVYTSQSFTLDFSAVSRPSIIPVTLIVKKQHNEKCFPGGRDADTLTRNLSIVWGQPNKYFLGTYKGAYTDAPNDISNISIYFVADPYGPGYFFITNAFGINDTSELLSLNSNLSMIQQQYIQFTHQAVVSNAIVYVQNNGTANMVCDLYQSATLHKVRSFKGQKIQ